MFEDRYNRQILLPEIGEKGQEKLRNASVLLVGAGGLGSPIALYLAGTGIGTLGIVDDDVVSVTNLHRQVLYTEADTGRPKALCAAERLTALNRDVRTEPHPVRLTEANARDLIARYDLVVDGCDNFATRYLIDSVCAELGKPYVYGAICGLQGQVSVFTYRDGLSYRTLYPDPEATLRMPPPSKAVVGITPGVVGSVEAGQVLQLICGYGEPLCGKLWIIDLRTMQSHIIEL